MINICCLCGEEKEEYNFPSEQLDSLRLYGDEVALYGNQFSFICEDCQKERDLE